MFFFSNDTATAEIYTLSLHDALPIWRRSREGAGRPTTWTRAQGPVGPCTAVMRRSRGRSTRGARYSTTGSFLPGAAARSEEHTSELQSRQYLVCRLLLEQKKTRTHGT